MVIFADGHQVGANLRGHIQQGTGDIAQTAHVFIGQHAAHSKISDFCGANFGGARGVEKKDVLGFNVPVDNVILVEGEVATGHMLNDNPAKNRTL